MIRVRIAAALLKSAGHSFEYRVTRVKDGSPSYANGTTIHRSKQLKSALARLSSMRVAHNDTGTVQIVSRVAIREGIND